MNVLWSVKRHLSGWRRGQLWSPTRAHRCLLRDLSRRSTPTWSEQALRACLDALWRQTIWIRDAWVEDEWTFCIVYDYLEFPETLGLRRRYTDNPGLAHFAGPDVEVTAPDRYGADVAVLDVMEPLGTVEHRLRVDANGVHWWGSKPTVTRPA